MEHTHGQAAPARRPLTQRLAGAPISWGACEVPGWGVMPSAERVLAEMSQLGLRGIELGAVGFLPRDPTALASTLTRHRLELVGGFTGLVLHERRVEDALDEAREAARLFAEVGGEVLVLALLRDAEWSAGPALDDRAWGLLAQNVEQLRAVVAEYGVTVALHPHFGTLIETAEQIERALEALDVGWCLDTGHLLIGGVDPAMFAREHGDRVVHVHLKDVDASLAGELRAGSSTLLSATRQGLFLPLGSGDAGIGAVLAALEEHGYDRWLVLEQDTAITGDEPAGGSAAMRDAKQSIAFLHNPAPGTQEVNV